MSLCPDSDRWLGGECHMSLCPDSDRWLWGECPDSTLKYEGRSENNFSTNRSDRLLGPLSPIVNEYQGSLTGVKRPGRDVATHRHLALSGAISVPSWHGQEQLYLVRSVRVVAKSVYYLPHVRPSVWLSLEKFP